VGLVGSSGEGRGRRPMLAGLFCLAALLSGCGHWRHSDDQAKNGDMTPVGSPPVSFHNGDLAMLTPTAAASHEEDRQALAQIFSDTLAKSRPDLKAKPLTTTLSAINAAGLATPYDQMYLAYKNTGVFDGQTLRRIGQAAGARYLVQLKLASFEQGSESGISILGTSFAHKQTADLRLTLQIWDASEARIVWERSNEESETKRAFIVNRAIKMEDVEKSAAEDLVKELPR
jgi:hypothetical protein